VHSLPWRASAERVVGFTGSLLPSRVLEVSLKGHEAETASYIQGQFETGRSIDQSDVIVSSKAGYGYRPIHTLPLLDRVFYQAVVDAFKPELHAPDRTDEAYEAFRHAPLAVSDCDYVVRADVSAFYQYIGHRALEVELVGLTGKADLAAAVGGFLDSVTGRGFGIPQNNPSSHVLSDLFIDAAERQLLRLGYMVWRYNDDFVVAAHNLRQAREFIRDFDRLMRQSGLTPNDDKTMILRRDQYAEWIGRASDRRRQLSTDLDIDIDAWLMEPSEYDDDGEDEVEDEGEASDVGEVADVQAVDFRELTVQPTDIRVSGSLKVLESWAEFIESQAIRDPLERYVHRQLARDAIRVLRRQRASVGLPYVLRIITYEPQMTHTVARYLASLAAAGDESSAELVLELISDTERDLSNWQSLWLLEPLWRTSGLREPLKMWVSGLAQGDRRPGVLRARAAFVLARQGSISLEDLGRLFDVLEEPARPDLVAAIATASEGSADPQVRSVAAESPIYSFIVDYVLGQTDHASDPDDPW
jgi:hypothetical protein